MNKVDPIKLLHTLAHLEDERIVKNPVQNHEKFLRYCKAIRLLKSFLKGDRGKAEVDDVNIAMKYHIVQIEFINDEFSKEEMQELSAIMTMFDSMMMLANCETGNISFNLMMEDIYTEAEAE